MTHMEKTMMLSFLQHATDDSMTWFLCHLLPECDRCQIGILYNVIRFHNPNITMEILQPTIDLKVLLYKFILQIDSICVLRHLVTYVFLFFPLSNVYPLIQSISRQFDLPVCSK